VKDDGATTNGTVADARTPGRKICLCMGVTDETIAQCYAAGHRTIDEIRAVTRACTRCFGCEADLRSFHASVLVPGRFVPARPGLGGRLVRAASRHDLYRFAQRHYHRWVRWRVQPIVLGALVVERADLHARMIVANVEPVGTAFGAVDLAVELVDAGGGTVATARHRLAPNRTLVVEARDLLRGPGADGFAGMLLVRGRRRHIGSLRPYVHYYNQVSIASTHDQWTADETRHHGFCTMVRVMPAERPSVHLGVSNLEPAPYRSAVVLTNHRGEQQETQVALSPRGTRVAALRELFADVDAFLDGRLGTVRFENWSHRAMYYFLAHDPEAGTWNVNHL
jgi:bacterioferritin-associated ferredoxin